jgi:hypothetical protein
LIPFEVKYRAQHTGARELKGLIELCEQKTARSHIVTKSLDDQPTANRRDCLPDYATTSTAIVLLDGRIGI